LEQVTEYCSKNPEIELWYRPLPPSIKGMTIWEQDMFIVVCNAKETNGRVRLKIVLHELGHYLLHRGFLENGKCARAGTEWFADQFEKEASLFALIAIAPDELVKRICNQYNEFDECVRHLEQEYTFTQEEAVVRIASYDAELRMISYQRVIDRFLAR
jgi:Zn-dependent peptidase ImmA (M78 family)